LTDATGAAVEARGKNRGFFWSRNKMKFRDILDGLANTIACGEMLTSLGSREIRADNAHNVADGLVSVTAMNVQLCLNTINPNEPGFYATGQAVGGGNQGRGMRWGDGRAQYTGVHTILPPNKPSCFRGGDASQGISTVGSRHQGGAHVLMGDGAVRFITDSIEAGNIAGTPAIGDKSPYGLWGALGTRASKETESLE
jgi:prepilin-type processing-associated H-X9-DG protein